ncbi:MAG: DUF3108 domain-containing protein [Candidatus Omnitrophica bacterium]|nr:DUF3108 domain-containing protein [Candidatus Omnitrophota bacterium]
MPNTIGQKIILFVSSITFMLGAVPVFAKAVAPEPAAVGQGAILTERRLAVTDARKFTLPLREKLVYRMKWMGITAGELTSEIQGLGKWRGHKAYRIVVRARTVGLCSKLYRIDDRYVSYLDAEELHTLRHEVHRREGAYRKDAVTDFDQVAHKAYFTSLTDGSRKVYTIPPHTQDTVTAAYYSRFLPLEPGRLFDLRVSNSENNYELFLKIHQRHKRVLLGKEREVFLFRPYARQAGQPVRAGRLSGYISADSTREPLQVVIRAPVFTSVVATLVRAERRGEQVIR